MSNIRTTRRDSASLPFRAVAGAPRSRSAHRSRRLSGRWKCSDFGSQTRATPCSRRIIARRRRTRVPLRWRMWGGWCVSCATMQGAGDRCRQSRGRWELVERALDADAQTPRRQSGSRCPGPDEQREQQGVSPSAVATAHGPYPAQRALRPRDIRIVGRVAASGTRPAYSVVPVKHAELLAEAMRRSGVTVEVLVFTGGGHSSSFPARQPPRPTCLRRTSTDSIVTGGTNAASRAAPSDPVGARPHALVLTDAALLAPEARDRRALGRDCIAAQPRP